MSIKIMSQVFENEVLGPTQKLLLLALADHADDEGKCYPSLARLARRTGLGERAVRGNLRQLEMAGYLTTELNAGKRGANLYIVRATPAPDAPGIKCPPAPDSPPPGTRCPSTPAPDAPEPSVTIIEPSNKDQSSPDPTFSEFWDEWPLRRVVKKKAETAFRRLSRQNQLEAITNARRWARQWREQNPTANDVHPTTYLNGHRWNDDFGTPSQQQTSDATTDRWKRLAGEKS